MSLTTGSAGSAASRRRIASSAGTLAAGSCALNVAIASSIDRAISAPPGTRFHVVSTPSRRSFVAGSPASSTNGSIREPSCHGRAADAEALRLVHATAAGGDRRERLARHRIPAADLDLHHARPIRHVRGRARDGHAGARIRRGGAQADVVDDAPRLPGPELAELLGKRRGVGGEPERFDGEHGGRGVMAVRGRGLRGEPRDDHVRAELADHAHDVAEDGLPVPDAAASPRSSSSSRSPSRG